MPSYQVPQFLDSGDKIIGPLNVRQFGYAMGGFMLSFLVFTIFQAMIPSLGIFAAIPVLPIVALSAFLAVGKYNGRDSEIYVVKYFLFKKQEKVLTFKREPNTSDLDDRLRQLTTEGITSQWNKRLSQKIAEFEDRFDSQSVSDKMKRIKMIGGAIDAATTIDLNNIHKQETLGHKKANKLATAYSTSSMTHGFVSRRQAKETTRVSKH